MPAPTPEQLSNLKVVSNAAEGGKPTLWQTVPIEDVFARVTGGKGTDLKAHQSAGFSTSQADQQRAQYGPNTTPSPPTPGLLAKIWAQFNNILMWILLASAVISGIFQDWPDLGLIVAVMVINVLIGVIQEGKAENAAAALQAMMAAKAMVIRDGQQKLVNAEDIVLGDVLYLQAGDAVVADIRLFSVASLRCLESSLTGEAEPVEKSTELVAAEKGIGDWKNCCFAGTSCVSGQGSGIVVGVGRATQLGAIKNMIESTTQTETPLQAALEVFGRVLSVLTIIVAVAAFLIAYFARDYELKDAFSSSIGIAVAIIPEGLPAVVTITLAIGVRKMAQHNAIIRQLPAVETLGSVSIVCSDKTGTLTLNQMQVTRIRTRTQQFTVAGQGYDPYSGEIEGTQGSVRKHEPALLDKLYWLVGIVGTLANDGGLVAPSDLAQKWPSQRNLPIGTPSPSPARSPGSATGADGDDHVINVGHGDAMAAKSAEESREGGEGNQWSIAGDPTDVALLVLGHKTGIDGNINAFKSSFNTIAKIPFDSDYKFVAVMQDVDTPMGKKRMVYCKGAWDALIDRCGTEAIDNDPFKSQPCDQKWWKSQAAEYATNGMRVLAVVQWEVPMDKTTLDLNELLVEAAKRPFLQLNCLVAILDPTRETAAMAVRECHRAGITVKMITGDHADTACYIAHQLGILDADTFKRYLAVKDTDPEARKHIVLQGQEIEAIPKDDPDVKVPSEPHLAKLVLDCNVYARVSPEHKLRIVRALKNTHGRITSMTGDGVNDAPALKEAHVGVAMGITGTDVAKQAAKMILVDDLFATIAEAVRRGRGVYDNLVKVLLFSLPTNFAQGLSIFFAIIIGMQTPLTAMQVLTVNLITSVTLGIVLALEEPEKTVMDRPPRNPKAPLLDAFVAWRTFYVTTLLVVAVLGLEQWELVLGNTISEARAAAFTVLILGQCLYGLSCRYVRGTALHYRVLVGNNWMLGSIVFNIAVLVFFVYTPSVNDVWNMSPIDGGTWGRAILLAVGVFLIVELEKFLGPRYLYPCAKPLSDCWRRCMRSTQKCCGGFWCNLCLPASSPAATGVPTPAEKQGLNNIRNAFSTRATTKQQFDPEGTVTPTYSDADEAKAADFIAARTATHHHHVAPVSPNVQRVITASKRRLDLNQALPYSTPSTRMLELASRSGAGSGGAPSPTSGFVPHAAHPVPLQAIPESPSPVAGGSMMLGHKDSEKLLSPAGVGGGAASKPEEVTLVSIDAEGTNTATAASSSSSIAQ